MQEFPLKCLDVVQQTLIQLFQSLIHSEQKKMLGQFWVKYGQTQTFG